MQTLVKSVDFMRLFNFIFHNYMNPEKTFKDTLHVISFQNIFFVTN